MAESTKTKFAFRFVVENFSDKTSSLRLRVLSKSNCMTPLELKKYVGSNVNKQKIVSIKVALDGRTPKLRFRFKLAFIIKIEYIFKHIVFQDIPYLQTKILSSQYLIFPAT